jgi:hypothetical protein
LSTCNSFKEKGVRIISYRVVLSFFLVKLDGYGHEIFVIVNIKQGNGPIWLQGIMNEINGNFGTNTGEDLISPKSLIGAYWDPDRDLR